MSAANIIDLYRRHGRDWDRARSGQSLFERGWLESFTALLPLAGTVLDLGCGGGEPIAAHLAGQDLAVTGIDTSDTLLALARARLPAQTWMEADMRGLELGRRFNGIIAWDSFFHLNHDDQRAMFAVFSRHAASGAALLFTSGPSHGEAIGTFAGEALYHASLAPDEYRDQLARAGFTVIAHRADDPECGGHTVWLAQAH